MSRSRRLSYGFLLAILAALLGLSSCATPAAKAKPEAAQNSASSASAAPSASVQKATDETKAIASALTAQVPEISFPYRRPTRDTLIVASLHEPTPPAKKEAAVAAAPPVAAPTVAAPSPSAVPAVPSPVLGKADAQPKPIAAAPKPSAALKPAATPKPVKQAPKAPAKADIKPKEPDAKNAPSTNSLAVIADPVAEKKPDIARNFSAVVGKRFEVPFDGTGWTYLGEQTNKEGIAYDSRRFETTSLVFILNPIKMGDYILRFQRQDSLRGISYEELVGVSVAAKPAAGTTAAAQSPAVAAQNPAATAQSPAVAAQSPAVAAQSPAVAAQSPAVAAQSPAVAAQSPAVAAQSPAAPLIDASKLATPEAALLSARSELSAGRVPGAIASLDRLFALAPNGTDEAYILYARALEQNGAQKDIKSAYAYYKKLCDEYPESPYWDEAAARVAYIERHYFDIR
jgi:hypothetical protein